MAQYRAPQLFGAAGNYRDDYELREYVAEEMIAMAEAGTLCVTDLMNQPPRISEQVGNVILGREVQPEDRKMLTDGYVPEQLSEYKVKLRALNGHKTALLKIPARQRGRIFKGAASVPTYAGETKEIPFDPHGILELRLPEAWRVLRFCGANCRKFKRTTAQAMYWRCEEVMPERAETADGESPRRRKAANA